MLSVSSTGELAVLTNATFIEHRLFRGTLARLTPGSSPRPWLDNVREADWSPDGATLAVIIDARADHDRLEYPIGTLLYEADGYLSDVRVSHDGQRVAFVEHRDMQLAGAGEPVRVFAARVTASFFPVLGVNASLGRTSDSGTQALGGHSWGNP